MVMVGGEAEALETGAARARSPGLATSSTSATSAPGQATKLCNNMLTAIVATGLGEVLVTGVKAGVELEPLAQALGAGSAGNFVLSNYLPRDAVHARSATPASRSQLMRKDLGLFVKAAQRRRARAAALSELAHERFVEACDDRARRRRLHEHRRAVRTRRGAPPGADRGGDVMTVALELPDKMLIGGEWVDAAAATGSRSRTRRGASRSAASRAAPPRTSTAR